MDVGIEKRRKLIMSIKLLASVVRRFGYDLVKSSDLRSQFDDYKFRAGDFDKVHIDIIQKVRPYTITSPERIFALIESVRYVVRNGIDGNFVECGVFKGGSMMVMALVLMGEGVTDRDLYLFDTFEGMPEPSEKDVDLTGKPAIEEFSQKKISGESSTWVNAPIDDVRQAMATTGYPMERVHFIKGLVENTIPQNAPDSIAVLRLDTDWYQSTLHELEHLYPRLSTNGILIVDDYGHFQGARAAVDNYFGQVKPSPFLHRIDYTGRLVVKMV